MKKILMSGVVAGLLTMSAFAQTTKTTELSAGFDVLFPAQDINWDIATGFTAQYVYWLPNHLGFAAVAGYQTWQANEETYGSSILLPGGAVSAAANWEGDLTAIPLGASVLYSVPVSPTISLTLEGGARYVLTSSDVEENGAVIGITHSGVLVGANEFSDEVEFGDGVVGVAGLDLDIVLSKTITLFGGAGYQFDLAKGEIEVGEDELSMENELSGVFVRGGLAWNI